MEEKRSSFFGFLSFLFSREDSTERYADADKMYLVRMYHFIAFDNGGYAGKIKAVFWMIVSILTSLAIANLR
ncbi:MAG: hypothetical protein BWK80_20630 [Desulfobacteraceae bacterium IS3]|nr:MAG: hypothetical protein BWK80_20630 [Desulfobacteraceae bacterium IS3]